MLFTGKLKLWKRFLKKRDDKEGHVFELLFSDELYNQLGEVEKKNVFGYKSFNVFVLKNKVTTR